MNERSSGWGSVVGQEVATETLRQGIAGGRVGHAYLFHGPRGVGKLAAALAFGQALLCDRGGDMPCGECGACQKVLRGVHADLRIHLPFPGKEPPGDFQRRISLLGSDPYARADFRTRPNLDEAGESTNKFARYPIDYVHEQLIRAQAFRPVEGRWKVTVVTDAHLLETRGSNALLKTLEEPPPQTVNVLLTDRHDLMLPTIVSRCEQLRFARLTTDELAGALSKRGVDSGRAMTLSRMADGSLLRAIELSEDAELAARRELAVEFLRMSYMRNVDRLSELVATISGAGREQMTITLLTLLDWIRDLLIFRETGDKTRIVNVDDVEAIASICRSLPDADLVSMVALVEEAIGLVERNANARLLSSVLAQRLGRAMRGASARALYVPLVADPQAAQA